MDADATALLLLRATLGVIMIAHGYNHWRGGGKIEGTARWFGGLGLKQPVLQAWTSVITEIGAGLLLIVGLFTSLAAAATISIMLVAGLLAHRPNGFFIFREGYEYVLALGVASLAVATIGPGRYSLDNAFDIEVIGWAGGAISLGVAVVATAGLLATFYRPTKPELSPEPQEAQTS